MRYLAEKASFGVACVDRLDPKFGYSYLRRRFQEPLDLPDGRTPRLERIIHLSMSCDGASHASSLVDIALGGFRYCVNTALGKGKGKDDVAPEDIPALGAPDVAEAVRRHYNYRRLRLYQIPEGSHGSSVSRRVQAS
jgi:hypothetical protein